MLHGICVWIFQVFNVTDFEKIIYLDADLLIVQDLRHLFTADTGIIAAAPEMLPPDKLQSGLMVIRPDAELFLDMIKCVDGTHLTRGKLTSYDGGDQGFINAYFDDWYQRPASDRLAYGYNTAQTLAHLYPPAWTHMHRNADIRVVHFSGGAEM
jgi:glycogenin